METDLPRTTPTEFCKAFIQRELQSFQDSKVLMSYWATMQKLIDRSDELELAFTEMTDKYGYSDKLVYNGRQAHREAIWFLLEHIWFSADYQADKVVEARGLRRDLKQVQESIVALSLELIEALQRREELFAEGQFRGHETHNAKEILQAAGEHHGRYSMFVSDSISALNNYDSKYWPSQIDLIQAMVHLESNHEEPEHFEFSDQLLDERRSVAKAFVVTFDEKLAERLQNLNEATSEDRDFVFSNKAMAEIMNVILDLDGEVFDEGTVRKIRHRRDTKRK